VDVQLANWNGAEMPLDQVRVSVLDRAFLFGDAVYEVLRVYGGRAFLWAEHLQRLRRSLGEIRIACDVDRLAERMQQTLVNSGVREGYVYIQVTRGVAARSHRFPDPPVPPNELLYVQPLDGDPHAELRKTGAALLTVTDVRWGRCDIKSVNLLANCLAAQAAAEAGCLEALLVDESGRVTEGSHTSAFGVKNRHVITTPLGPHILPGITRKLVLELASRADVPVEQRQLRGDEVSALDEMFLTGTTAEVLPVTTVDGTPIGDGKPGPVTERLYAAYRQYVAEWLNETP
jgi:D-alanine transaminase